MPRKRTYRKRKTSRKRKSSRRMKGALGERSVTSTLNTQSLARSKPTYWSLPNGGLPPRVRTTMRYDDLNRTRAPGLTGDVYTLNMNSLYDVDNTSVGHQPNVFDTFAALYERYKVRGCKVKLHVRNTCASPIIIGTTISSQAHSAQAIDKLKRMCQRSVILDPSGQKGDSGTIQFYVNFKKFFGPELCDSAATGYTSASPTRLFYCQLMTGTMDESTLITYRLNMQVQLQSEFFDPVSDRAID